MPTRLVRYQQTGHRHFITFSCYKRRPYLEPSKAAKVFLLSLEAMRVKYKLEIFCWVVMPEHVHVLLGEPPTHPLSTVIGSLKRSVSKQMAETPFWMPRYHDRNIFSNDALVATLRYTHRNPVKRNVCSKPEDYQWSSFCFYAYEQPSLVQVIRAV